MSKVVLDVSMSLDGFIAGPNGREAEPRRIPPRKSGPPRRSRGTPIRILEHPNPDRHAGQRIFVVHREEYVYWCRSSKTSTRCS